MVNPKHVRIVKKGTKSIKEWRKKLPGETLDLSGADLSEANLSEANLCEAELGLANLIGVNLSRANLSKAHLFFTNLNLAVLHDADLSEVDAFATILLNGELSRANLTKSTLEFVDFRNTDLDGVDFTNATMFATQISSCDLSQCMGLETVEHSSLSNIDIGTLMKSFKGAGNRFTPEMNTFFLNAGVPKELLDVLPHILTQVKYCSCFIAYGHPDVIFATRLVKDLRAKGVSCWLYEMHSTPGKRVWKEITQKRREAEKMIVLCSAKALIRDGVLKEIEEQIDEDPNKIVPISLDDTWKQSGFVIRRGHREDSKTFLLDRTYADFCDESKYKYSLERLLKGIKKI